MALIDNKILEADLLNKGVIGLPDTPNLSTSEMQEKFDEIAIDVITPKHNQLIDDILLENATKLDKANPSGTGSLSLNRKPDTTVGTNSVAIGNRTTASASNSLAEGESTTASGTASHAEGNSSTASGQYSHAEGRDASAKGYASHAEGYHTDASSDYQHVHGKYNIADANDTYAEIVGGGTSSSNRVNIKTLDWSGNLVVAGNVTDGNGNVLSGKQDTLVSGTNIKTVGGNSLLGSGDVTLVTDWDDLSNKPFDSIGDNLSVDSDGVLSATDTTYDVVDDYSDGLCPQLPNPLVRNGSFLSGNGTWEVPAGSVVSWNQIETTGTKIATVTINNTPTDVYAPTGGGGGASTFAGLDDVTVTAATLANGQVPTYNSTSQKWENANLPTTSWSSVTNKPFDDVGLNLIVVTDPVSGKTLQAIDTTYDVETPVSGGQTESLVTTGDMYNWNTAMGVWATNSAIPGATSVTFSNAYISSLSILDLYSDNQSGTPVAYTSVSITTGYATYSFPALEEATQFKLWIRNI